MADTVADSELAEDTRYDVEWNDCCAAGKFTATLTRIVMDPPEDGEDPFVDRLEFDNGVTLNHPLWGVHFTPAGGDGGG